MLKQLINTSITRGLLKVFGLRSMPQFKIFGLSNAMRVLKDVRCKTLNALKSDRRFYSIYLHEKQPKENARKLLGMRWSEASVERMRDERAESILILLKAQKVSNVYLDVNKVMQASKVTPFMRLLKRQFRIKLKLMQQERYRHHMGGWQYLQDILPVVALNVWHVIDFLLIFLAIAVEFIYGENYTEVWQDIYNDLLLYNLTVVGLYGMITLGEVSRGCQVTVSPWVRGGESRLSGDCIRLGEVSRGCDCINLRGGESRLSGDCISLGEGSRGCQVTVSTWGR
ncbi:hypothetical protein BaRGS_00030382 [Batillaria attramentaria]|uniref:Uncharacterized protein n=1 Tax=Batillaria attramentaria TaxID=370345 RepID=A0ABD0JV31_9CAEN